ncbi:MAG: hypothetical protein QXD89_02900 [Candidatus Aenigmatarchaeota archaeon]
MRKLNLILTLIIWLLVSFSEGKSQISIVGEEFITTYVGENKTIEYSLTNNEKGEETFLIFLSGLYKEGISIDVYPKVITLLPNQTEKINVYIETKKNAKELPPTLFFLNVRYGNQTVEKKLILHILRKYPVYISSLELSRYNIYPLESLIMTSNIENVKNEVTPSYKVTFKIFFEGKEIFSSEKITDYIPALGKTSISEIFQAEKYQNVGKYEVIVNLFTLKGELIDEVKTTFEVKPIEKIPKNYTKKEVKYSLLEVSVRIEVKNEGNIVSRPFYLIESLPNFMKDFFTPSLPPTEVETSFGYVSYKWLINPLSPGESFVVEYKISLWQTWSALVIIILFISFFFRRTFLPIIKKEMEKDGKRLKIFIRIKNSSKKPMKEIKIEDSLPPMFKIISYFGLKPQEEESKKTKEKILVWKINELKEEEEAIFGYQIEPLVEIVLGKLPKAKLEFTNFKGEKIKMESNEVNFK